MNESISLLKVEPFHGSGLHDLSSATPFSSPNSEWRLRQSTSRQFGIEATVLCGNPRKPLTRCLQLRTFVRSGWRVSGEGLVAMVAGVVAPRLMRATMRATRHSRPLNPTPGSYSRLQPSCEPSVDGADLVIELGSQGLLFGAGWLKA